MKDACTCRGCGRPLWDKQKPLCQACLRRLATILKLKHIGRVK